MAKKNGKRIEEYVKGSLDYRRAAIRRAFEAQFPSNSGAGPSTTIWVDEVFDDHVVVHSNSYDPATGNSSRDPENPDEYYQVNFTQEGEIYTFDAREKWTKLADAYQPVSESLRGAEVILEAVQDGARRVRIERLMTAGKVNGNNRRYPAPVLRAAVSELSGHLHESAGQGRLMILGEVEHPGDKPARRANLMETVIRWTDVSFDGSYVNASGLMATETEGGKHIQALAAIGVAPGGSIRGYGQTESVKTDDGRQTIEEVTELHLTGIDLVAEPSFGDSQTILESVQEDEMTLEELMKLMKEHPDAFAGITEAQVKAMGDAQLKKLEETLRSKLGLDASGDISKALDEGLSAVRELNEQKRRTAVDKLITEATKELPYGKFNENFVLAIKSVNPQDEAAVKSLVEAKRKEYDAMFSAETLKKMGFTGKIQGIGSVLENETGTPEFARAAFQINESLRKVELKAHRNLKEAKTRAEIFTQQLLERFDAIYKPRLMAESRQLEEAEQASDLSLPYSVSRAIIEEAYPNLVAAGIFDVGIMSQSPDTLFYETFAGETGYSASLTPDESVVITLLNTWYDLANKRLTPGSVVVKNSAKNVIYTEGTQYLIDYANGRIKVLTTVVPGATVKLTAYDYTAVRKGEMQAIERGKLTLATKTIVAAADRLADQISREAIVFSRSQLGYDATARTLASLAKQLRRKVDEGLLYQSVSAVMSVANNSAGTWTQGTTQDDLAELVRLIGVAKTKVSKRYYQPTAALMSDVNAESLTNWEGFTAAGKRPGDELLGSGFVGSIKALSIFQSTEFPDTLVEVVNGQLVMHRVYQPMQFQGPYPTYDGSGKIIAADQYYTEEFNATEAPVPEKGAYVTIAEGS